MSRLPPMKAGTALTANKRPVPFSFWPVAKSNLQRNPVQSLLFAIDPWTIMKRCIAENTSGNTRGEADSYIDQAFDFYRSALRSQVDAAKPLQLYYSYLNIAKAFILYRGRHEQLPSIQHGISEAAPQSGREFFDAEVRIWPSPGRNRRLQAFDEFNSALGHQPLTNSFTVPIPHLLPQILPGHRLWAASAKKMERFISIQKIQFTENTADKEAWIRFYLYKDDLTRLGHSQIDLLRHSGLDPKFRRVKCAESHDSRNLICFEQDAPSSYNRHGVDLANSLSEDVKDRLWVTVASNSPYRRYYLYICPDDEVHSRLPQLASIYALTFYLGSLTRYRPTVFRSILDGAYGPRIVEFISGQPEQFIYLMASEFAEREITKPALV